MDKGPVEVPTVTIVHKEPFQFRYYRLNKKHHIYRIDFRF